MTDKIECRRVMTARGSSVCNWCGGVIVMGSRIGLVDREGWQDVACIRKRQLDWSVIAEPSQSEAEYRHAAEQERAVNWLRSHGNRIA